MVKACKDAGYSKLILCDNNLSGVVQFYNACKKEEIKPVIGVNIKVSELPAQEKGEHNRMYDLVLIAKNKVGYKNLLKILSKTNEADHVLDTEFQRVARIHLDEIKPLADGLVCVIGQEGTELGEVEESARPYTLDKYKSVFSEIVNQLDNGILWDDVRYLKKEDREDFLVLLCILCKCTLKELPQKLERYFPEFVKYLTEDKSLRSKQDFYSFDKAENTEKFLDSIEEYDILSKPKVPKFDCPDGMSQQEYLTELCRLGWKRRFPTWESEEKKKLYADRVKHELSVIQKYEFDGYFLIVQDYINWAKRKGWLIGHGRGSSAGCLLSYLLRITEVDSIKYDIIFERFLQEGRTSLPDIDTDFPKYKREEVIDYIKNKIGISRVCHISTYGTLKGAGALTEVFRCHSVFEQKKIKSITKVIPSQDKISDKMESEGETSVILYTLKYLPDLLKELGKWEDGKIVGEYSYYLEQAIRLEGCIRNYGIHASGILISDDQTDELAPMIIEANGDNKICALEMGDSENVGLVKVDILGSESLDRLMEVNALLGGYSEDQ